MTYIMKGFPSPLKQYEGGTPPKRITPGAPIETDTEDEKNTYEKSKYGLFQKKSLTLDKGTVNKESVKVAKETSKFGKFMGEHAEYLAKLSANLLISKLTKKEDLKDPAANFAKMQLGTKPSPITRRTPLRAFGHIKAIFGQDELWK